MADWPEEARRWREAQSEEQPAGRASLLLVLSLRSSVPPCAPPLSCRSTRVVPHALRVYKQARRVHSLLPRFVEHARRASFGAVQWMGLTITRGEARRARRFQHPSDAEDPQESDCGPLQPAFARSADVDLSLPRVECDRRVRAGALSQTTSARPSIRSARSDSRSRSGTSHAA